MDKNLSGKRLRAAYLTQGIVLGLLLFLIYMKDLPDGITSTISGASPGFGRGGPRIFFPDFEICMSRSDMLRMAKQCALLGGFGGMPPRENFLKWCNLVRFGVYFDQILSLKNFKNYHFLYKKFKN